MSADTVASFIARQAGDDIVICQTLRAMIDAGLPEAESRIWHRHPVWFLQRNPIVGFSRLKAGVRLMFWSGAAFDEGALSPGTGKFMDASITYTTAAQIEAGDITRWLEKARHIQWDYKNLIRNRGLKRLA